MKTILALLVLVLGTSIAQAQSASPGDVFCGYIDRDGIQGNTVKVTATNPATVRTETRLFTPHLPAARAFLSSAGVHGGLICGDTNITADAPFAVCISGNYARGIIALIACDKVQRCEGPNCGGNGFSVSGSAQ